MCIYIYQMKTYINQVYKKKKKTFKKGLDIYLQIEGEGNF